MKTDSIVLGGGCFWCLEAAYQQLQGVSQVISGYSGGESDQPTYELVSSGKTGHVEVVMVSFDPDIISLDDIMAVFWVIHDPTSVNRQGADVGEQYASVVYYRNEHQKERVLASRVIAQSFLDDPIVTRIEPLSAFYAAEAYHQNYYAMNSSAGYCQVVIEPKLSKLRQHFSSLLKS